MKISTNKAAWWVGMSIVVVVLYYVLRKYAGLSMAALWDSLSFERGMRLGTFTRRKVNAQGYIPISPTVLLAEASQRMGRPLDIDVFALATSGRSEGVNGMPYRMHVMLNQADEAGLSVFELTVRERGNPSDGFFGEQLGRRWASPEAPYEGDYLMAEAIYAEHQDGRDRTAGATRYYDISAFGVQLGSGKEQKRREQWLAEGYSPYHAPDATNDFVLWSRNGVPDDFEPYV